MTQKPTDENRPATAAEIREARLKAALKANMAKRKAQARAKAQKTTAQAPERTNEQE